MSDKGHKWLLLVVLLACAKNSPPPAPPTTPAPLAQTPPRPAVEVVAASGDPFASLCGDSRADAARYAASLAGHLAACKHERTEEARMACKAEAPSEPQCEISPLDDLDSPWGKAAVKCEHFDMSATPWRCSPVFVFGKQLVIGPSIAATVTDTGLHEDPSVESVLADLLPEPGDELFVRAKGAETIAFVCVGGAKPECSEPIDPAVLAKLPDPPTLLPASAVVFK